MGIAKTFSTISEVMAGISGISAQAIAITKKTTAAIKKKPKKAERLIKAGCAVLVEMIVLGGKDPEFRQGTLIKGNKSTLIIEDVAGIIQVINRAEVRSYAVIPTDG